MTVWQRVLAMLTLELMFHIKHQPFYISICISWTLSTQQTTYILFPPEEHCMYSEPNVAQNRRLNSLNPIHTVPPVHMHGRRIRNSNKLCTIPPVNLLTRRNYANIGRVQNLSGTVSTGLETLVFNNIVKVNIYIYIYICALFIVNKSKDIVCGR